MVRTLHPRDAVRCVWPGSGLSGNLATPCDRLARPPSRTAGGLTLLREGVLVSRASCVAVSPQRGRPQAVALARMRSGPRAWEVAVLHVAEPLEGPATLEVLDRLAEAVGQKGALRLFLRVPCDSSLLDVTCRAGFVVAQREVLLVCGRTAAPVPGTDTPVLVQEPGTLPDVATRPCQPTDDVLLFHLYSGAVPAHVRALVGMTREEWRDGRERGGALLGDWVLEHQGKMQGWARVVCRRRISRGEAIVYPESAQHAAPLLDLALAQAPGSWQWLVPEHQSGVMGLLGRRGFREVERYCVLVRPIAAPVSVPSAAPAVEA